MEVNVAVSGRFHFHNYVRYLDEAGVLGCFYYAHRMTTDSETLGIEASRLVNVWMKEYLLQGHARLLPWFGSETFKPYYRALWEMMVLARWRPCDLLHIMLHGGGRRLMRRARMEGSVVIGEPVNAHPELQNEILSAEWERLKIRRRQPITHAQRQMLEEVVLSDRLIVASHFLKRSYVEKGYPKELIEVIPYGVDLRRFSPAVNRRGPEGRFKVICVAGINVRKGIIDLLDAWRMLGARDGELLLVGRVSSEMIPVLKRYIGVFKHIPHIPNDELGRYLSDSTVFVLPSLEDGFGLVCSEAMACGVPVIATCNTGAAELIENDISGYVVPIRAPEVLEQKMEILYLDREKARAMGEAAARTARSLYDWKGYAERLVRYYSTLLATSNAC